MVKRPTAASFVAFALIVWAGTGDLFAQEPRPEITDITLAADSEFVALDVTCTGLFSERIIGTVQSGLPAVVDLLYYFTDRGGGVLAEDVSSFALQYDVWDDIYFIESPDTTRSFPSFATMQQAIERIQHLKLVPLKALKPDRSYRVHMSIIVNPLKGIDRTRIADWVSDNVRTRVDDSWREQVLNLNNLISHFFSREREVVNQSAWYRSEYFKPDSLRGLNREAE